MHLFNLKNYYFFNLIKLLSAKEFKLKLIFNKNNNTKNQNYKETNKPLSNKKWFQLSKISGNSLSSNF